MSTDIKQETQEVENLEVIEDTSASEDTEITTKETAVEGAVEETADPHIWWGRVIFHVDDVDQVYQKALDAGLTPLAEPRDAPWGERFFAITDPSGHDLSFAKPLTS